ncbi:hypothetical protein O3P69_020404 [Scylla paramamosain]|uniref:Secreted protein n=1 Tax=Scylla paramamosain TaxID=85552 RepID=A0AAW0TLM7_SCYPA
MAILGKVLAVTTATTHTDTQAHAGITKYEKTAEVTQQLIPQQAALPCAATTTTTTSEGGGRGTAHQIVRW